MPLRNPQEVPGIFAAGALEVSICPQKKGAQTTLLLHTLSKNDSEVASSTYSSQRLPPSRSNIPQLDAENIKLGPLVAQRLIAKRRTRLAHSLAQIGI